MEQLSSLPLDDLPHGYSPCSRGAKGKYGADHIIRAGYADPVIRLLHGGFEMELKINPLFQDQIPPLTELEFQQLEDNVLKEGRIINPLITWNGFIVDGHNRFRILQAHPELPYETYEKEFSGIPGILAWICKNQLGRRNLTPAQRKYLI